MDKKSIVDCVSGDALVGYARILVKRNHGGVSFWSMRFNEEDVQAILTKKTLMDYVLIRKIMPGSLVYLQGEKFVTESGEHSILIREIREVNKCDWWLPDKFHGLNQEHRYRKRVLDLISNKEAFELFDIISRATCEIRTFLYSLGYREFNTNILQEQFEAGQAKPFITKCNASGKNQYLSLTSELKLKKLLVAGFERVFEITQSFRNEGIDAMHSPEFTLLEIYAVAHTCQDMIDVVEKMVQRVAIDNFPDAVIPFFSKDGSKLPVSFAGSFRRLSFVSAFEEHVSRISDCNLRFLVGKMPGMFCDGMTKFTWMMKVVEKLIAPKIMEPTFLTDLPVGLSPFVKIREDNHEITERAFFLAHNLLIADIYTDENDYASVESALKIQAQETGGLVNGEYLKVLRYGLPPTAGIGLGLNRLFMLFLGNLPKNVKETILYPVM